MMKQFVLKYILVIYPNYINTYQMQKRNNLLIFFCSKICSCEQVLFYVVAVLLSQFYKTSLVIIFLLEISKTSNTSINIYFMNAEAITNNK